MVGDLWLEVFEVLFGVVPVLDRLDDHPAQIMSAALALGFPGQQTTAHQAAHEP
ncbi:hypothetical protein D3C87_2035340 [compost metagenome]